MICKLFCVKVHFRTYHIIGFKFNLQILQRHHQPIVFVFVWNNYSDRREGVNNNSLLGKSPKYDNPTHHPIRDWHFGFETSQFQNFWQFFEGLGLGFGKIGLEKDVSVLVSEILVSEKSIGFDLEKFGLGKKSRFRKICYRKKSLGIGVGQNFGIVIQWLRQYCWWLIFSWNMRGVLSWLKKEHKHAGADN